MTKAGKDKEQGGDKQARQSGFTLLELLVVLTLLGLFAIIATPRVLQYLSGAKSKTAQVQVEQLGGALDLFRLDVGRYPTEQEGIVALVEKPGDAERWNGPYVKKKDMLKDPWGESFHYRSPGQHGPYDLYSLGADKQEGGEGENKDVLSW